MRTRLVAATGLRLHVHLRSDNGPEFVSEATLAWLKNANVESAYINPGKPWQNGTDERFNARSRDGCLTL